VAKVFAIALMCLCGTALAQGEMEMLDRLPATHGSADAHAEVHLAYKHPKLPADARWAGATTLLILGMFLAAAAVGVVVYSEAPALTHAADGDSHDEHHGHDAGHGHGAYH
jgi:hypothetical protein